MFLAAGPLRSKWPNLRAKNLSSATPLSYIESTSISQNLSADGVSMSYSAFVSLADAIRGIEAGFYSWSTVKLYYSVFYTLRALLAFNQVAVFYINMSPFWVTVRPGERPHVGGSSSSHKVVMDLFRKQFKNSPLLSQPIGYDDPLTWLQAERERVNYKQAKFTEPSAPPSFSVIDKSKSIRRLIAAYMADDTYAFDPDHAILAYPIAVLKQLHGLGGKASLFDDVDQDALHRMIADSRGPIALFDSIIGI